jgi:hypothetical protein
VPAASATRTTSPKSTGTGVRRPWLTFGRDGAVVDVVELDVELDVDAAIVDGGSPALCSSPGHPTSVRRRTAIAARTGSNYDSRCGMAADRAKLRRSHV